MAKVATDERSITHTPDPGREARVTRARVPLRDHQLDLSRDFARLAAERSYVRSGAASMAEWGLRRGYSPSEVRRFVAVGQALEKRPEIAALVREGRLHLDAVALVWKVLRHPAAVRKGEDWLLWAQREPLGRLRRRVRERLAEVREQAPVAEVSVHVTEEVHDEFGRARIVASRKAGRWLAADEVFVRMLHFYLDKNDPCRTTPGKRRAPPTIRTPYGRDVPEAVKRAIRMRSDDFCEVPDCQHGTFLEFAHIRPRVGGSSREERDLLLLCATHHTYLDAGTIRFAVWADGAPTFQDSAGRLYPGERGAAADPGERPGQGRDPPDRVGEPPPPRYSAPARGGLPIGFILGGGWTGGCAPGKPVAAVVEAGSGHAG